LDGPTQVVETAVPLSMAAHAERTFARMDARAHFRLLLRSLPVLIALPVIAGGAAYGYTKLQTPLYEATASVYVSAQSAASATDLSQGNTYTQEVVKSYAQIAVKPIVLDQVIKRLGLDTTPAALAPRVTADAPLNTTVLNISAVDASPAQSAAIANAVTTALVDVVPELSPSATGTKKSSIKITPVQSAVEPAGPISPNLPRNLALGLILGLALAVAYAYARAALDVRIRSVQDVQAVTDRPILGGLLYDRSVPAHPLVVHLDPKDPRAESFRTMRTNLQFIEFAGKSRLVVVTSALPSEGKSTSASNLAIALADAGERVLLVDADLRRPRVHTLFGLDGAVGLTDVLIGRQTLADAAQPWGDRGLAVLPSGAIPPNPSELLQSHAMLDLLATLREDYDTVIIDAPPVLPVTDAAILAKLTDGAIVVAAANRSSRNHLRAALTALEQVRANVLGMVVTMLPRRGADAGGYGYGYSYGPAKESPARGKQKRSKTLPVQIEQWQQKPHPSAR
jgi:capsular exopolysaccharide synthesis family protein